MNAGMAIRARLRGQVCSSLSLEVDMFGPNNYWSGQVFKSKEETSTIDAKIVWSAGDDAYGLSAEDRSAVIRARYEDWDYRMPGITPEPPEVLAIFEKYRKNVGF